LNLKEYISSGIIESYVLNLASNEERREFEELCLQYPELVRARIEFEIMLENQSQENAIPPPAEMKTKILDEIANTHKLISLPKNTFQRANWWKYAAAACLVLLAGSIYMNILFSNKNKKLDAAYKNITGELATIREDIEKLKGNPEMKMTSMKGTDVSPLSYATVYWDTTSQDVYLMLNNLPKPAADKQYQLWALLDGQPIDLGLIDNNYFIQQNKLLIRAKNVQTAQAFAITLERKGRTDTSKPEGAIYVMGNL